MYIWDGWGINGIEFQYSDGYTILHGGRTESEQSITLASNERVTGLSLYGDGTGDHLGYIYMETDKGQTFQGGKDVSRHHERMCSEPKAETKLFYSDGLR